MYSYLKRLSCLGALPGMGFKSPPTWRWNSGSLGEREITWSEASSVEVQIFVLNNSRELDPSRHSVSTRWEHCHTGINKLSSCLLFTCCKAVLDLEANPFQLFITEKADPHEASTGEDKSGTGWATEAIYDWRETERAIPYLDVVETTLKWGLDVEVLIKLQLYPLAGQGWGKQSAGSHLQPQMW